MHHHFGTPRGELKAPQVLTALLLRREEQRLAILFPHQRRMHLVVPFAAEHLPIVELAGLASGRACQHRQLVRHGVLGALVAGGEGNAAAVGAVAWRRAVPVAVLHERGEAAAFELKLGQREAAVDALFTRRVEGKHDVPAVR